MFAKSPGFTVTAMAAASVGAGNRRDHGDLFGGQCDPAEADAGFMTRTASCSSKTRLYPIRARPDRARRLLRRNSCIGGRKRACFRTSRLSEAGVMNYTGGEVVEQLRSMQMSADNFKAWGITIQQGRGFTQEEDLPDGPRVAFDQPGPVAATFHQRSADTWPHDFLERRSVHGDRSGGEQSGRARVRTANRSVRAVPARSEYHRSRTLLSSGGSPEARRYRGPGQGARLQVSAGEYRARFPSAIGPRRTDSRSRPIARPWWATFVRCCWSCWAQ